MIKSRTRSTVLSRGISFVITLYQRSISPDHSAFGRLIYPYGCCRYTPTCSEYARRVIHRDGAMIGGIRVFLRVLRCTPWARGGQDDP